MEASKCGWIIKLSGAILAAFLALPTHAQLMLAHEGHHDAGGCTINDAEFPISFSGYEVPEGDLPPLHSYCSNIPKPGKVQLTIELPDWDSRDIPLAIRLVEAGHAGHGGHDKDASADAETEAATNDSDEDAHAEHDDEHAGHDGHEGHDMDEHAGHDMAEEHGIVYLPYEVHRSGIIVVHATLDKGHYEVLLERQDDAGNVVVAGRIPFGVGGSGGHGSHGGGFGFGLMEFIILLLVAVGGGFYFLQRKKEKVSKE